MLAEATPEGYAAELLALNKLIKAGHKDSLKEELSKVENADERNNKWF